MLAATRAADLPDLTGCYHLLTGFWQAVRHDLAAGSVLTARWVCAAPGFVAWCRLSGQRADEVRAALRRDYPRVFALAED